LCVCFFRMMLKGRICSFHLQCTHTKSNATRNLLKTNTRPCTVNFNVWMCDSF
jgi:hypothetical protein